MSRAILDTGVIIRFLVADDAPAAERIEKLLRKEGASFMLPDTIVAEVVWVMTSVYRRDKVKVCQVLRRFLGISSIEANKPLLELALYIFESKTIDYIDAYLAALALSEEIAVYSFDKDLSKIQGVTRLTP